MILRCLSDRGKELPSQYTGLYYTEQTVFDVTVGQDYQCHALALFNGGLIALLYDDSSSPSWYPIDLFMVSDGSIPSFWKLGLRNEGERGLQAVIGYPDIASGPEHYEALIEGDPRALEVFKRNADLGPLDAS